MNLKAISDIRRKLKVISYAKEIGNFSQACRYYFRQLRIKWYLSSYHVIEVSSGAVYNVLKVIM